jgi:cell division protein FtsQ
MAKRQMDDRSRADQVRARKRKSHKETRTNPFGNSAARKKTTNRATVSKRQSSTPPVINRKRRKAHLSMNRKGAEVRIPAIPRLRLGWRWISGAAFILSLVVVICFSSLSTFTVSAVDLEGAERLGSEEILSKVDIIGDSIITIQPEEVKAAIESSFPSLSSVDVSVGLPSSVSIQVVERQPLILWQMESTLYWIDSEGLLFTPRGEADVLMTVIAADYPPQAPNAEDGEEETEEGLEQSTAAGTNTVIRTSPEFILGILSLQAYIPEESTLQYDPEFGLGWQDPQGWMVYFGKDISEMDLKLVEYQAIVERLIAQNITPALISLEFIDAPFYRLEQ